jgi:hypothetical protein
MWPKGGSRIRRVAEGDSRRLVPFSRGEEKGTMKSDG